MGFVKRVLRKCLSLQEGPAHRVIFYYQGEEPTYLEEAFVTVFHNGLVEVRHKNEHVSTHMQNVEILWKSRSQPAIGTPRKLSLIKNDAH